MLIKIINLFFLFLCLAFFPLDKQLSPDNKWLASYSTIEDNPTISIESTDNKLVEPENNNKINLFSDIKIL